MSDVTLFKVITAVETALKDGLGDLKFNQIDEDTDITKEEIKLVRLEWQDDDKLFINVDLGMQKIEKALNHLFIPNFRKELVNYTKTYARPTDVKEYINDYYSTYEEIRLDGGLICLYKVLPIDAVTFNYEIDNKVTDKYKKNEAKKGKKYADKRFARDIEKKLMKDVKNDLLLEELESLIIQIAFIVEK